MEVILYSIFVFLNIRILLLLVLQTNINLQLILPQIVYGQGGDGFRLVEGLCFSDSRVLDYAAVGRRYGDLAFYAGF